MQRQRHRNGPFRWRTLTGIALGWLAAVALAAADGPSGRLTNLSVRAVAAAGDNALTAGFVIAGPGVKRMLVRAAGPALANFAVTGALTEVRLELYQAPCIASNAGWDAGGVAPARCHRGVHGGNHRRRGDRRCRVDRSLRHRCGARGDCGAHVRSRGLWSCSRPRAERINFDPLTGDRVRLDLLEAAAGVMFAWSQPDPRTGISGWPVANPEIMPAGYTPPGTSLAGYLDFPEDASRNLRWVGVFVPADAAEAELMRARWQSTGPF